MDHGEFNQIITKLPLKIKNEVKQVVNTTYIHMIPVIAQNFSENFTNKLLNKLQEIKFIPGDIILQVQSESQSPQWCSQYVSLTPRRKTCRTTAVYT